MHNTEPIRIQVEVKNRLKMIADRFGMSDTQLISRMAESFVELPEQTQQNWLTNQNNQQQIEQLLLERIANRKNKC